MTESAKPYNLTLAHSHRYMALSKADAETTYEHCVDCGHLRQAPYVTDESAD